MVLDVNQNKVAAEIRSAIEDSSAGYYRLRFFDLRNRFGIRLWSASRKKAVADLLASHGVVCEPPLTGLSLNDWVTFTLQKSVQ